MVGPESRETFIMPLIYANWLQKTRTDFLLLFFFQHDDPGWSNTTESFGPLKKIFFLFLIIFACCNIHSLGVVWMYTEKGSAPKKRNLFRQYFCAFNNIPFRDGAMEQSEKRRKKRKKRVFFSVQ